MARNKDKHSRFGLSDIRERDPLQLVGDHQDGFPRLLLLDPDLSPTDKIVWHFIRIHVNPVSTDNRMPAYSGIMNALNLSRSTVANAIAALRVTRWICVTDRLRNRQGYKIGSACTVHTRPATIGEALELDANYIDFLERCEQKTTSKLLGRLTGNALADVRECPQSDPGNLATITKTNYLVQRTREQQEAEQLFLDYEKKEMQLFYGRQIGAKNEGGPDPLVQNLDLGISVPKATSMSQSALVQNLDLGVSEEKQGGPLRPTCGKPSKEALKGVKNGHNDPKSKFLHEKPRSSCSNNNKTTTTLLNQRLNKNNQRADKNFHETPENGGGPLRPTCGKPGAQRETVHALHFFEDLIAWTDQEKKAIDRISTTVPASLRQSVLDETVGMIVSKKDTPHPVRNAVLYFRQMCAAACDNTLTLTSAASGMSKRREWQVGARDRQIRDAIDFNRREQTRYTNQLDKALEAGDQDHVVLLQGILSDLQQKLAQIKAGELDA